MTVKNQKKLEAFESRTLKRSVQDPDSRVWDKRSASRVRIITKLENSEVRSRRLAWLGHKLFMIKFILKLSDKSVQKQNANEHTDDRKNEVPAY